MSSERFRPTLALALALVAVTAAGAGAVTGAYLSDRERASASVGAASDFTVDAGTVTVRPDPVPASAGRFKVDVVVPNRSRVDEGAFTLAVDDARSTVEATRATCRETAAGWRCTATFSRDRFTDLPAVDGAGTYHVVLRGWWTDDRDFRADGSVTLRATGIDGNRSSNATATATVTTTSTPGTTTSAATSTTTAGANSTVSPTATSTTESN